MENNSILDSNEFNDFLTGYRECAVWCGVIEETDTIDSFSHANGEYDASDLAVDAVQESQTDCASFFEYNLTLLEETGQNDFSQHGHDFWLSRNRHGAGFWDRSYGALGDILHRKAKVYGSTDLFVGNDERLHFMG